MSTLRIGGDSLEKILYSHDCFRGFGFKMSDMLPALANCCIALL
jgi:hypothetical protein